MSFYVFFGSIALIALGIAATLAMAETALSRLDAVRLRALAEEGRRGAATLVRIVSDPERFATSLNGVLFLQLGAQITWVTAIADIILHVTDGPIFLVFLFLEVLVGYVLGTAMPKTLALQNPERAALLTAPLATRISGVLPMRLLTRGLIGVANVLVPGRGLARGPFIYEQQILALTATPEAQDAMGNDERNLIRSVIEFRNTIVREVMVPRTDIIAVGEDRSVKEALDLAMAKGYSRLPVYRAETDRISGVVFTKDLVRSERSEEEGELRVADLRKDAKFVPETKRVVELLHEMQSEKVHIAIVVDEYGSVAGMATLEDLIEEVVGEITDEYDSEEAPLFEELDDGEWRIDARTSIDEINERLAFSLPEGDWDTLGGLLIDAFERVPARGETIDIDSYRFWVDQTSSRRVKRARVKQLSTPQ